jgi:hypothetical protein
MDHLSINIQIIKYIKQFGETQQSDIDVDHPLFFQSAVCRLTLRNLVTLYRRNRKLDQTVRFDTFFP